MSAPLVLAMVSTVSLLTLALIGLCLLAFLPLEVVLAMLVAAMMAHGGRGGHD